MAHASPWDRSWQGTSVAFGPDGKLLASASWDKTIILWDMETRQPLGTPLTGHQGGVGLVLYGTERR